MDVQYFFVRAKKNIRSISIHIDLTLWDWSENRIALHALPVSVRWSWSAYFHTKSSDRSSLMYMIPVRVFVAERDWCESPGEVPEEFLDGDVPLEPWNP